ncbi:MAG: Y-family DNA polymerase [Mycoplasma sp.]
MKNKIIFHIDINYFFCRCEEIINPKLENLPFVTSERSRRGIICSSNKLARNIGIKAPMLVQEALKLCPNLIIIDLHHDLYSDFSNKFIKCIEKNYTDKIERMSIDECYVDVTDMLEDYHNNHKILAQHMLSKLKYETGLLATIGIGNNKFLAKMAGDSKPSNKIAEFFSWNISEKIWPLELKDILGVGVKTNQIFKSLSIETVLDFLNYDNQMDLKVKLKSKYDYLKNNFLGYGDDIVDNTITDSHSISRGRTFGFGIFDKNELIKNFDNLSNSLYEKLRESELACKNFIINIKLIDGSLITSSTKIEQYTNDRKIIFNNFVNLLDKKWDGEEIKSLTLSVSNLININSLNNQLQIN